MTMPATAIRTRSAAVATREGTNDINAFQPAVIVLEVHSAVRCCSAPRIPWMSGKQGLDLDLSAHGGIIPSLHIPVDVRRRTALKIRPDDQISRLELRPCDVVEHQVERTLEQFGDVQVGLVLLSLIHISEPTRLGMISYAVFCL